MLIIDYPKTESELNEVRALFKDYVETMGFDLAYQGFEDELASLPGKYAPPTGYLLLAKIDDVAAGCVAIRKIDAADCEMKRLYVAASYRRQGLAGKLTETILNKAREFGYVTIKLDTLRSMSEAMAFYESYGFTETSAYIYNPHPDAVYLELKL